jgi:transposase-like protein
MSPRKLTAADKKAIVSTYRSSADSMAVLAARYGVSNSTVSRLLKNNIPELEYESLISDKRAQKGDSGDFSEEETLLEMPAGPDDVTLDESTIEDLPERGSRRRVRRRSSAAEEENTVTPRPVTKAQKATEPPTVLAIDYEPASIEIVAEPEQPPEREAWPPQSLLQAVNSQVPVPEPEIPQRTPKRVVTKRSAAAPPPSEPEEAAGLLAIANIFDEDMGDLLEDDEDFGEEDGWSEMAEPSLIAITDLRRDVQPLSAANLPRTCYIVVDRFAELVACPLAQFAELGGAVAEAPQNTLPVFDNHRVAKRFSNDRNQRVIKVPDSRIFQKTTRQLAAKGINLLLVDGQVYSLN